MTTELFAANDGDVLHVERFLPHPVAKVWRCLTEPDLLRTWFPSQVEIDLRVGGRIRFFGDPNLPEDSFGTITELDPPRLLAFDWGGDLLRWQVEPRPDGSLLVLDQSVSDRPGAASFAAGWNSCLDGLAAALGGSPASEASGAGWPEQHEKFVSAFGLDSGAVSPGADGWDVRLERQLTAPVASVREFLPGTALASAELRPGHGGARLVARRNVVDVAAARALLDEWEVAARELALRALQLSYSPST